MKDLIITLDGSTVHHQIDDADGIAWDTDRTIEYRDGMVYETTRHAISWRTVTRREPKSGMERYEAERGIW